MDAGLLHMRPVPLCRRVIQGQCQPIGAGDYGLDRLSEQAYGDAIGPLAGRRVDRMWPSSTAARPGSEFTTKVEKGWDMDPEKRKRLEAAGWKFGDAADFLELTDGERQLVEARLGLSRAVRAAREAKGWTQGQLAKAIASSLSRVAKIESAAQDVTVDLMLRALFTAGGQIPESLTRAAAEADQPGVSQQGRAALSD